MNIVGGHGDRDMVHFLDPSAYLFGSDTRGNEQGGIYNRSYAGVRIERLPDDTIVMLDHFYRLLKERQELGACEFILVGGRILNNLR